MARFPGRLLSSALAVLAFLVTSSPAQRPSNASVCDYYATQYYGVNSSDSQRNLVRHIVVLAFEGGSRLTNKSEELTGILRPGRFGGQDIDLLSYFNGSRLSTNVNNGPVGVNWLDQGGTVPLAAFLAGETETLVLTNTSNQFHLFGNFFVAFSRAFGCTLPFPPLPNSGGPVSLAYAHKFMNLEFNQLGYFIYQLTQASMYFGFSAQDAETFRTRLNSLYNVRCAPAVTFNPAAGPQLLSLCQNPTCPLAAPVSDCAAYENLTANGIVQSNPTTIVTTHTATITGPGATNPPSQTTAPATSSESSLSTGAIAGIAIGGAAVLVMALGVLVYFLRKKKTPPPTPSQAGGPAASWVEQQGQYGSPTLYPHSPYSPKDTHMSYYSNGAPPSEMGAIGHMRVGSPEGTSHASWQQMQPVEMAITPVEMDSAPAGAQRTGTPSQYQQPTSEMGQWAQQPGTPNQQWQPLGQQPFDGSPQQQHPHGHQGVGGQYQAYGQ